MIIFVVPMVFGYAALGLVTGAVVGRRFGGNVGAVLFATALCLAPLLAGAYLFRHLILWEFFGG
jgi:hypothetical protein